MKRERERSYPKDYFTSLDSTYEAEKLQKRKEKRKERLCLGVKASSFILKC